MTQTSNDTDIPTATQTDTTSETEQPRLQLSMTQIVASALAAMTAAVIGAQLSVAGTVIGAAVGSVTAGLATALYTISLQRTQRRLATLSKTGKGSVTLPGATASRRTLAAGAGAGAAASTASTQPDGATAPAGGLPKQPDTTATAQEQPARRRRPWKVLVTTAAVAFVLAVVGITAIELATGQAVSGGRGTTISQVSDDAGATTDEKPQPAQDPSPAEQTPSDDGATYEPTGTEESEAPAQEPTPTPTEEPSTTPTEPPSTTPTDEPTEPTEDGSSVEPGAGAGGDGTDGTGTTDGAAAEGSGTDPGSS